MNVSLSTVASWSYGLAAAGYAAISLQLWLGVRGGIQRRALLAAVTLSAIWGLLAWAFATSQVREFLIAAAVADVLRIGGWYVFLLLLLLDPARAEDRRRARTLLFAAAVLVGLGLLAQVLFALEFHGFIDPSRLAVVSSLGMAVFALVLVETLFRSLPSDARWSIKPVCIGLVAAFAFDIYLYADALLFRGLNADAFSVRGFAHAVVIPLVALAAMRSIDWTSRITVSRRVVVHSAALAVSGVYLLFVAAAGYYVRYLGGEWGGAFQTALLFTAALLLFMLAQSASMRAKLKVLISKHFFSYRYDYREEWLRFTKTLSACEGQSALGQQIITGLAHLVESPSGALWVRDASRRRFAQSARWNMSANDATEPIDSNFARFLLESGWVVNLDEHRSIPRRYGELQLPAWLREMPDAWLIVPLTSWGELIGFVVLGTPRTAVEVNWEVNDVLKTTGSQAASFLAQAEATEALLETRKFEAFSRMSAFVVHDLKNIISQLSLMMKNAQRHKHNPEFQQDMELTIDHAVEQMKKLLLQLCEGTTPIDAPRKVDLAAVIRRIQRTKAGQQPCPEVQLEEQIVVNADEERMERVIGHLVQNAIDATNEDGRVWIKLERVTDDAVIEISDTGHGMTPEFVREHLFKPFQSTKRAGMGIGAYESYQYVHELGGNILVETALNVGTHMRVLLPLAESSRGVRDATPTTSVA